MLVETGHPPVNRPGGTECAVETPHSVPYGTGAGCETSIFYQHNVPPGHLRNRYKEWFASVCGSHLSANVSHLSAGGSHLSASVSHLSASSSHLSARDSYLNMSVSHLNTGGSCLYIVHCTMLLLLRLSALS
jgi:hypothetical protein